MCENTSQMKKVFRDAYECYQSTPYVCAYLEKMYPDILREYRARGAGPAGGVSRSSAALSSEAESKDDRRVVAMREGDKASFAAIGKALRMTPAKARHTYEWFYHDKVLALLKGMQEETADPGEKTAILNWYLTHIEHRKSVTMR